MVQQGLQRGVPTSAADRKLPIGRGLIRLGSADGYLPEAGKRFRKPTACGRTCAESGPDLLALVVNRPLESLLLPPLFFQRFGWRLVLLDGIDRGIDDDQNGEQ